MPTTLNLDLSLAAVISVAATDAAPDISNFISVRPAEDFRLIPPESNVTPFPTRTTVFLDPFGLCSKITILDLLSLPAATANIAPNFFCFSSFSPNTVTLRFSFLASATIERAKCSGRLSLDGVLTHSLARIVPWQIVLIRDDNRLCFLVSSGVTRKLIFLTGVCFFSFLYLSKT